MADFADTADELRQQLLELVALLGLTLEESKTPVPANTLEILGVEVRLNRLKTSSGETVKASLTLGETKRRFWADLARQTLATGKIEYRELERLVGRLAFAAAAAWGPIARGHLTALYALLARGGSLIDVESVPSARQDLEWWTTWLLEGRIKDIIPHILALPSAIIYSDAEKNGGIGAVLFADDSSQWLARVVHSCISSKLKTRKTQIFPYEVVASVVALAKWKRALAGRRVVCFVDNIAARGSLASGRSSQPDVNGIIGFAWRLSLEFRIALYFVWVPSALNVADGPSRGDSMVGMHRMPLHIRWESIVACMP